MTSRRRPDRDSPREHQFDPLADVLRERAPPEARLGPYPADDLIETPAPKPSLVPFASAPEPSSVPLASDPVSRIARPLRPAQQKDWPALLRMLERRGIKYAQ